MVFAEDSDFRAQNPCLNSLPAAFEVRTLEWSAMAHPGRKLFCRSRLSLPLPNFIGIVKLFALTYGLPPQREIQGVVVGLIAFTDRERLRYAGPVLALLSVRRRVP